MPDFKVPADIKVGDFFKNFVPKQFEETLATSNADLSFMQGKEFTLQFNIDDNKYCILVKDGKTMSVVEGGIDKPMLTICISENFWRDSVTGKLGGSLDQFSDTKQIGDARRYEALKSAKGTLTLDLKMDDGSVTPLKMVFNGEANPSTKLMLAFGDFVDMQTGKADGQALFMQGRMQFEGDMMFLMSLQQLM